MLGSWGELLETTGLHTWEMGEGKRSPPALPGGQVLCSLPGLEALERVGSDCEVRLNEGLSQARGLEGGGDSGEASSSMELDDGSIATRLNACDGS